VIAGTSAGAAVMSPVMIARGRDEAILADGFDLLPGTILDQHFLQRNRVKRLIGALKRHPELIGLGVDEGTALLVDLRSKRLNVLGQKYVVACIPTVVGDTPTTRLEILKPGDEADLKALRDGRAEGAVMPGIDFDAL
jgi:cyanophycinase